MAWWWNENWGYRKSFSVSRASGYVTNYPIEMYIGESSTAFWTLDACEATTNFLGFNGTVALDNGIVGTNCVKVTGTNADSGIWWRPWKTLNFQTITQLKFYSKRSANASSQLYIFFGGVTTNYVRYDYANTTDWTEQTITLSNYASSSGTIDWSTVWAFRFDVDGNGAVLWLDDLKAYPKEHVNGKGLTNFNDLRFTTIDNFTVLPYYISKIFGTTPNQVARVYVKFNSIETSSTYFYMYYGNANASEYSNGANVFRIFDDFERGVNNDPVGNGWSDLTSTCKISTEQYASGFIGTRSCKLFGNGVNAATDLCRVLTAENQTYSIKVTFFKENAAARFAVCLGNGSKVLVVFVNVTEDLYYYSTKDIDTGYDCPADMWHELEIKNINFSAGTYDIYIYGALAKASTPMASQNWWTNSITFENYHSSSGNDVYVDNIIISNWRPISPIIDNDWGEEEECEIDNGKRYWIGGSGYLGDSSHWAFSSGGKGGKPLPTINEEVIFDENSFSVETSFIRV